MSDRPALGAISPLFIAADSDASIDFYRDALGFDVRLRVPEPDPFFAIVGRDGVQIQLKVIAPEIAPQPNPSRHEWARWDAFVSVDDPDAYAAELVAREVRFSEELKDWEDGLRGFAVQDRDGYTIFFGRPV